MARSDIGVTVHPRNEMIQSGLVTFFVTTIPLFGVLYWYTASLGIWPEILAAQVLIAVGSIGAIVRQRMVHTTVTDSTLSGNGIFSRRVVVPLDSINSVALVPVFGADPNEVTTQLLAIGEGGRCVFRMRGYYWHPGDLTMIASAIGRPICTPTVALSEEEFFEEYPGSRYWFERNKAILPAIIVATVALVAIIVLAMVHIANIRLT